MIYPHIREENGRSSDWKPNECIVQFTKETICK